MRKRFGFLAAAAALCLALACPAQDLDEGFERKPPAEPPRASDGSLLPPLKACQFFAAKGEWDDALDYCRKAYEEGKTVETARLRAQCEFSAGDPEASAELWQEVLDKAGWNPADATARAKALWRAGRIQAAEKLFLEIYDRSPSADAVSEIMGFYLGFSRWGEAEAWGGSNLPKYAKSCGIIEKLASAKAALEKDADAAGLVKRAMAAGCGPYRWATLSGISDRLNLPVYKALLDPKELVKGLDPSDKDDCLTRLTLLRIVETPAVADAVADVAIRAKEAQVRFLCLGILQDLGPSAMSAWAKLFACDDFVVRKYAYRRQLDMGNVAFDPLLEKALVAEKVPGNRQLLQLVLGQNLLLGPTPAKGEALLQSIPDTSPLFPAAAVKLSEAAEARKDYALALSWLEKAVKKAPDLAKQGGRLEKLKALAGKS